MTPFSLLAPFTFTKTFFVSDIFQLPLANHSRGHSTHSPVRAGRHASRRRQRHVCPAPRRCQAVNVKPRHVLEMAKKLILFKTLL